ncbi:MAG: LysR family transcriptional regulator [Vallitaleaceae bacterium]|nr:LysR family transcriptional regulator [Vallitaleaceae bacterium]
MLRIVEDTKNDFLQFSHIVQGKLRIGASLTIGEYYLPTRLGEFHKQYPGLELELIIENTQKICERMNRYEVDIALVEGRVVSGNLEIHPFYKDHLVLVVPREAEGLIGKNSFEELQHQTWISREEGSGTREYLEDFLMRNQIQAKNVMVFGSNYSIKEAVKNKLGVTLISSLVVEEAIEKKDLLKVVTEQESSRHFSYLLKKGIVPSKAVEVFIEFLTSEKKINFN